MKPIGDAKVNNFVLDAEEFKMAVNAECVAISDMLIYKNSIYGNSALNPVRIFSHNSPIESILVRIDDKLSRIQRGKLDESEDTIMDLIGYLILLRIANKEKG